MTEICKPGYLPKGLKSTCHLHIGFTATALCTIDDSWHQPSVHHQRNQPRKCGTYILGVAVQTCNLSAWEGEAGGSWAQGHSWLKWTEGKPGLQTLPKHKWDIYITEFLTSVKNKVMSFLKKWMKPDLIILSEQNQSQKDRHVISFICASYTFCVNRPIKSYMYMTWKYKKSCLEEQRSRQEGRERTEDRVRSQGCPRTTHHTCVKVSSNTAQTATTSDAKQRSVSGTMTCSAIHLQLHPGATLTKFRLFCWWQR